MDNVFPAPDKDVHTSDPGLRQFTERWKSMKTWKAMGNWKAIAGASLGVAGLGAVTLLAGVGPTPSAHAETGREYCLYATETVRDSNGDVQSRGVAVVENAKGDGCPGVNPDKFFAATSLNYSIHPENKPLPKFSCTELPSMVGWDPFPGQDPCTQTADNHVYVFTMGAGVAPEYRKLDVVSAYF
jgi:hypothetical protein